MAFGLAAYVSRIGFPPTRKAGFQVLVKLSWAGFYPQSSYKRFSTHFMWVILLFQASWHNQTLTPISAGRNRLTFLVWQGGFSRAFSDFVSVGFSLPVLGLSTQTGKKLAEVVGFRRGLATIRVDRIEF